MKKELRKRNVVVPEDNLDVDRATKFANCNLNHLDNLVQAGHAIPDNNLAHISCLDH